MKEKHYKAWHFLKENGRLAVYGKSRALKIIVGKTYSARKGESIRCCGNGMHGSLRVIDALVYAPGPILERVEMWGEPDIEHRKMATRYRKAFWLLDITNVLHEFACREAEDALALFPNPDPRSLEAIRVKRLWINEKASCRELAVARGAAEVAWDAAYAGRVAAFAAREAAWDAARNAARDAAFAGREAARFVAVDAARARVVAADAVLYAVRARQNRRLGAMVTNARKKERQR